MRNSVCVWLGEGELAELVLQEDCNDMVSVYWGKDLEIYVSFDELKHLSERIESFLEEKDHVISKR